MSDEAEPAGLASVAPRPQGAMPNDQQPPADSAALLAVYQEICANIRATDEISFNLLRTIPFISALGSGALAFLPDPKVFGDYHVLAIIGLSLFGAAVTVGLGRWERRNIEICRWLISRAAHLERKQLPKLFPNGPQNLQFAGMVTDAEIEAANLPQFKMIKRPARRFCDWGKTESSALIYWAAIAAWLIPPAIALLELLP
jgi:hypothetical protein